MPAQPLSRPKAVPRHVWGDWLDSGAFNRSITLPADELPDFWAAYPYRISPVTDDSPFFWHFARFRDVIARDSEALRHPIGPEDGRGESALLGMLALRMKDQKLLWDSKNLKFTNNDTANELLHIKYRDGWHL